jgi:hypothetical protein
LVSLRPALPATGVPILTPAGLSPAEHIGLSWTHNRAGGFPAPGSPARFWPRLMRPAAAAALSAATSPPTPPDPPGSAFPWAYIPVAGRADHGCFSQGTPASRVDKGVTSSRAPSLHGHYPAFAATAGPSATLSSSAHFPVLSVIGPTQLPWISPRDEEGFSSCWVCPGRRAVANHPAGETRRVDRLATGPAAFAPPLRARPPGLGTFGATTRSLRLRPGDSPPSQGWVVNGLQVSRFPSCLPFRLRGFRLLPRRD